LRLSVSKSRLSILKAMLKFRAEQGDCMSFAEVLKGKEILILDGAMGTQLAAGGLEHGGIQNLLNPEIVRAIHEDYARAGAQIILTNTITANRVALEACGRGNDISIINKTGVELARSATGRRFVLGDISSSGKLLEPYGEATETELAECFREQAEILAESGVDGLIVETMIDLREAVCALKACRRATSLPVVVSLSFSTMKDGGRTVMGNKAEECVLTLAREGADAVGVNCGNLDPFEVANVIALFRENTDLPLFAQPNAGKPRVANGETIYNLEPDEFARGLMECVRYGARFVGGCCGTTPKHIEAAAQRLRKSAYVSDLNIKV
jgi:5-methyltetrahydrofolate--homocysteine methyltransferase